MRVSRTGWVLPLALLSIVPLVVLGFLVVERLIDITELRHETEVASASYAAELAAVNIAQELREEFRPRRERLTYAHMKGQAKFERELRDLYYTTPLLDVPQFVEESLLRDAENVSDQPSFPEGQHRCDLVVAASLTADLVQQGRARMGFDPATRRFAKAELIVDDAELSAAAPLRWVEIDLEGPLAHGCPGCAEQLARIGVRSDEHRYSLLALVFPLPGGEEMRAGMFGAIVPAGALLREVVEPQLHGWTEGGQRLGGYGLRVLGRGRELVLPWRLPSDPRAASALKTARALHAQPLLGEDSPWQLEVVALSGFDIGAVRDENRRWLVLIGVAALLLALGALLFTRSFLHQVENTRLRSHLLSNVSHELKTPLSLIRLYTETLENGRVRSEEEGRKFLGIVGREAKRLTHLIDNLLDVQRIEEDRKQYSFAQVRPDRVVRDTVEAYRYQLVGEGFDLRLDVDADLPLLHLDEEALAQALINLLDNAAKYSDTQREIRVRLRGGHDEVTIAVQDRGIGIPVREQEKIFQSFYRVEKSLVHDVKGSGLGLAVVAHVAQAHGGRVTVDSTPGKGSTFTLHLPIGFEPEDS